MRYKAMFTISVLGVLVCAMACPAEIKVVTGHNSNESTSIDFKFKNITQARYDGDYRISANFLNWVTETYDRDIVRKLNVAAREGRYSENLWIKFTGHTVQELGDQWKESLEKKIAAQTQDSKS